MAEYKLDCAYFEPQRLRPYCNKLLREIRPKNCEGCGWYSLPREAEELGLGAMTKEDVDRMNKDLGGKV